jgi:hypothetical protein
VIIVFFGITSYLVFNNAVYGNYSGYYQKLGIGFMRIATNSFYWFVPPIFSLVIILLLRLRRHTSATYTTTGFLLVYCAIGNSIYFFGRSHEHNIINISISLLFVCFIMLDLMARFLSVGDVKVESRSFLHRYAVNGAAIAIIALIIVCYSQSITRKTGIQIRNIGKAQLIYPSKLNFGALNGYLNVIRTVTGNSEKVYFISSSDFELYYYGGFSPVGYCNPFMTWIFSQDLHRFLQRLLDNGYYLVSSGEMKYLLADLSYDYNTAVGNSVVIARMTSRKPVP